ncbi:hypothetical protein LTR29_013761 [Friedmanniomyces endolithicus]|nr:hypothetical protein LTR29_013761 [Friedmanniomyces endolithicus]KAK1822187.1 hypothetical protein LTR12_003326 [Friedmanniomyces endolithicus]
MNEPISAQVARTDAARLLRRRHEYQLQRNAVQDSPLLALPAELLLEIVSYSGPIDRLCLRQASQQLRCQIATPSIPPHQLPATTHCLIKRLGRDDYIDLLRYEHGFRHLRATYLCCSACYRMHHRIAFTHAERAKGPRLRQCKDAQALLRVCSHETRTHDQLMREVIATILSTDPPLDGALVFACQHRSQASDDQSPDCDTRVSLLENNHLGITTFQHLTHLPHTHASASLDAGNLLAHPSLHICPHTLPTSAIFQLKSFIRHYPPLAPGWAEEPGVRCCTVAECGASVFFGKYPSSRGGGIVYEMAVERLIQLREGGLLPDVRDKMWKVACEAGPFSGS